MTALLAAVLLLLLPGGVRGQELADFDYENLSFRGLGVHGSVLYPSTVESTALLGIRADLGYLGPGLRIVPSIGYWSSEMKREEVAELERSVARLVDQQSPPGTPPANVSLGTIDRSDLVMALDGHVVFSIPWDLLSYAGAGAAVHFLNGSGDAVDETFVEDLLDSVTAGFNLHGGLEYPLARWLRLYGEARYEILGDIRYGELRFGTQFMLGSAPQTDGGNR